MSRYTWSYSEGYECSTRGDKRFSSICARLDDGRTIEMHYQCDIKGYDPGGQNWRLGKGKPPLKVISQEQLWQGYLFLWKMWAARNRKRIRSLRAHANLNNYTLCDSFAKTPINQAAALAHILNEDEL